MNIRNNLVRLVLAIGLIAGSGRAASAQNVLAGALGGVAGTLSGGYITLAIVVGRAQAGHYLHDVDDLFGWTALPVLLGGTAGTALGYWEPDRLVTGFVYGSAGTLIGGTAGFLIGSAVSKRSEGKWAGGAIGAGIGMAAGAMLGVFKPNARLSPFDKNDAVVPLGIRIPL